MRYDLIGRQLRFSMVSSTYREGLITRDQAIQVLGEDADLLGLNHPQKILIMRYYEDKIKVYEHFIEQALKTAEDDSLSHDEALAAIARGAREFLKPQ